MDSMDNREMNNIYYKKNNTLMDNSMGNRVGSMTLVKIY